MKTLSLLADLELENELTYNEIERLYYKYSYDAADNIRFETQLNAAGKEIRKTEYKALQSFRKQATKTTGWKASRE